MSQIIENWTDVTGRVRAVEDEPGRPGFMAVELDVEQTAPVAGFADLIGQANPATLRMLIPTARVDALALGEGARVEARVRRAGVRAVFCHPERVRVTGEGA